MSQVLELTENLMKILSLSATKAQRTTIEI